MFAPDSLHTASDAVTCDSITAMNPAAPQHGTPPVAFIVDDDPMMGTLLGVTMEGAGYDIHTFTDGREAHAQAASLRPDILLVDLTMPLLSGAETIARLRKVLPGLPVIVISGVSEEEALAAAPDANAYLKKPFPFANLVTTAEAVLSQAA